MSAADRIKKTRAIMAERGLDAMLVTQPQNVYYLSGFRPHSWNLVQPLDDPEGFVLVQADSWTLICDDRFDASVALNQGADRGRISAPGGAEALARIVADKAPGAKKIGFEAAALRYNDARGLFDRAKNLQWVESDDLVTSQRLIKTEAERNLLRAAAKVTDGAYAHALKHIRIGMTEKDLAMVINNYLRENSEGCSFNTIVGFGETASAPHYEPNPKRKLEKGHIILMDFGSIHEAYMGDMTRMAVVGPATDKQKQYYAWVLEAQLAGLATLKPGVTGHEVDKAVRDVFEKHGVLDKFLHGTGHGIGLAVHEAPSLKPNRDNKLVPGTVFSVEPGLYEAGWGGIRIEDLVIMTESGPENITHSPKMELIEVDG